MKGSIWLKTYLILSGVVFTLVATLHLVRLIERWPVVVGTRSIPLALSYIGLPVAALYALWAFWLVRR